jgi:hypothetical protein
VLLREAELYADNKWMNCDRKFIQFLRSRPEKKYRQETDGIKVTKSYKNNSPVRMI